MKVHALHLALPEGYLRVSGAGRGERLRAEPFEAIELSISAFFGDD